MYRVPSRLARVAATLFSATFLLSGCVAGGRSELGGYPYRSIKDDPEPEVFSSAPKQAPPKAVAVPPRPPKTAVVVPPRRPKPPRAAEPNRTDVPTCATGSECMVRLKAMIDDRSRAWIGQPQAPVEYANGTRLFAYRALRSQLTCPQLGTALDEITAAGDTFHKPVPGVSALQAKRVLALNAEVERELRAERTQRCKG